MVLLQENGKLPIFVNRGAVDANVDMLTSSIGIIVRVMSCVVKQKCILAA